MSSRPRGWNVDPARGTFESLLDEVLGSGVKRVVETVVQTATFPCNFCSTRTVLRCNSCGSFVCNVHAFVNAQAWNKVVVICSDCMSQFFSFVDVASPSPPNNDDGQDWPYSQPPWEVLGVSRNASETEINAAFKKHAKTMHPDAGGTNEAMSFLASARMWMLTHIIK
jgi:hypothetical protein